MIADVVPRLNGSQYHPENWLSMRPDTLNYSRNLGEDLTYFGEMNRDNTLHGRGIFIFNDGRILIGFVDNGECTGNYITIRNDGYFEVGEIYLKDGDECMRGTRYNTDGIEEQCDE